MVPDEEKSAPEVRQVVEAILDYRKAHPLDGENLEEWINEGRRL